MCGRRLATGVGLAASPTSDNSSNGDNATHAHAPRKQNVSGSMLNGKRRGSYQPTPYAGVWRGGGARKLETTHQMLLLLLLAIWLRCGAGSSAHARSLRPAIIYKDNESGECEYLRRHRRRGYTFPKYTRPRFSVESTEPYWSTV